MGSMHTPSRVHNTAAYRCGPESMQGTHRRPTVNEGNPFSAIYLEHRTYYWLLRSNSDDTWDHNSHYLSEEEWPQPTTLVHSKSYQRKLTHPHNLPIVQRTYRQESSGHSICEDSIHLTANIIQVCCVMEGWQHRNSVVGFEQFVS